MTQNDNFFSIVCCPNCRNDLVQINQNEFLCNNCMKKFLQNDNIFFLFCKDEDNKKNKIGEEAIDEINKYIEKLPVISKDFTPLMQRAAYWDSVIEKRHLKLLEPYLDNAILLDNGCGTGNFLKMAEPFISLGVGIDASIPSLRMAIKKNQDIQKFRFFYGNVLKMPFKDNSFEIIISSEVIEHVSDPADYAKELFRVLKPGGFLTLSTPSVHIHSLLFPHNIFMLLTTPHKYFLLIHPEKDWNAALKYHPSLSEFFLFSLCKKAGFKIIKSETTLWYYWTPLRLFFRFLLSLERMKIDTIPFFDAVMMMSEYLLEKNIPIIRCFGSRQIIMVTK